MVSVRIMYLGTLFCGLLGSAQGMIGEQAIQSEFPCAASTAETKYLNIVHKRLKIIKKLLKHTISNAEAHRAITAIGEGVTELSGRIRPQFFQAVARAQGQTVANLCSEVGRLDQLAAMVGALRF